MLKFAHLVRENQWKKGYGFIEILFPFFSFIEDKKIKNKRFKYYNNNNNTMETQTGFKFNFTAKEDARKLIEQQQSFKDLDIEQYEVGEL